MLANKDIDLYSALLSLAQIKKYERERERERERGGISIIEMAQNRYLLTITSLRNLFDIFMKPY